MSMELADFLGPAGGMIAVAWASGAASGYVFASKLMKSRIDYLENQIKLSDKACDARVKFVKDQLEREVMTLKEMINDDAATLKELQRQFADLAKMK